MEELNQKFEAFYKEHYEKLYITAYRITGNKQDAEDVIQETYMNAYKSFATFEHNSSFGTWIYRIMLNCSYSYIKKRDKLPIQRITAEMGISEMDFWNSLKSNDSVEENAMLEDIRETCIQLFLNCISPKQRITFTLKVLMQLPVREVVEIMGISESAVKVNVHRAKQHLEDNMEGRCSFINPQSPCQCANWVKYLIDTGKIKSIPAVNPVKKRTHAEMTLISSELDFLRKVARLFDNQPQHSSGDEFIKKMKDIISGGSLKILA